MPEETDEKLDNGLKFLFSTLTPLIISGAGMITDNEEWAQLEDEVVKAFKGSLRTNGYEIVPIER